MEFWHGTGQFYKQRKSCGDVFSELLVYTSGLHRSASKEWDVQRVFFFPLSSMQIGGRWKLENGAESFQVHTVPVFPAILASLHLASGAMPTSCCFQDRKGKHRSLLCAATRPPATSPTSAAHPKLARASTGPRLSLQQGLPLQPSSAVQREAPTPQFLLWISFSITPASPLPGITTTPTHPPTHILQGKRR